ncbi:uncharacterized protein KY384_000587 [Bacidia gigantensis]|uniref:uncharacterized protein n=1 Tax=Bacidia gigantensis TaxID=2732470 RepID=UPI001D050A7F|nr:uncharacterized protein KY384_000587 [Bacidia gigantensis]KAG8525827.1 hypothetical protein KY384_000587 [Bacidia gigantensis]
MGPSHELKVLGALGYTSFEPRNVETILSTRFEGEGIFTQDGAAWKHSRELLRRPFQKTHYQDLKGFSQPLEDLTADIATPGGVVDLQPLFFRFTLATTTALIFGQPVTTDINVRKSFASNFDYASLISALRTRLVDFYWVYNPSEYKAACKHVKAYADSFIERALGESNRKSEAIEDRYGFVEDLYENLEDKVLVRNQLVNVLLAGRDTTACLLSWTLFLLVRHRSVLKSLQAEIQTVMKNKQELTRQLIQKMPYLRCILNETLRLYPPIPINVRFARRATILPCGGGPDGQSPFLVRRGQGVGIPSYYLHRRKDLYGEDAEQFRPERWEGTELADIGYGYLPFHGGHRLCLGKDFALTEASCAIVRILQEFPNIRIPPEALVLPTGDEKQELTVFLRPAEGCKVLV